MNNMRYVNKIYLLIASRAYLQQSPTCTRVPINLVYNFCKSRTPIAFRCSSCLSRGRGLKSTNLPLEICMCFATLLCHLVWHHTVSYDIGEIYALLMEWDSTFRAACALKVYLRETSHARKTAQSNHTRYFQNSHIFLYLGRSCDGAFICNFASKPFYDSAFICNFAI